MTEVSVTWATEADLEYIEWLLDHVDLPTDGIRADSVQVAVATVNGDPVGCGAIEHHASEGLLRSVAVDPVYQSTGVGSAICDHLEAWAVDRNIDRLFLLTTTAASYFAARGYRQIDRSDPPQPIQETAAFSRLCPDSAVCMVKRLS